MDSSRTVDYDLVSRELGFSRAQVEQVVALLDEGNTVPFITRYRKERTGDLDEEAIRAIQKSVELLRQLAERSATIIRLIEAQGLLTPELRQAIADADSLKRLEDLYLPFRPKRRSRAQIARERGLDPLAQQVLSQDDSIKDLDAVFGSRIDAGKDLNATADVRRGVSDIIAESIAENAEVRALGRRIAKRTGHWAVAGTKSGKESQHEYRDYFEYREAIGRIPPHRVLAINRGEEAGALRVRFEWDQQAVASQTAGHLKFERHRFSAFLHECIEDAVVRLLQPSLDRELHRELTDGAEEHATSVFGRNLRSLLLAAPLQNRRVVAIDPGFRTGCKLAALDERGQCIATDIVYVTGSAEKRATQFGKLATFLETHDCRLIAIGNGTACRETEELVSMMIDERLPEARYIIVNEAGASIYSTSTVARTEFPDQDATVRGTISIGRRLQDPLSELVKIEPQHIGVGMYQHDISPKRLESSLDEVVESCVNYVGVDVNTASASLLRYVSGLNQLLARRVVEYRDGIGKFTSRKQLLDVPGIGEGRYTQAAGFLKIQRGDEPLDATWIHPESYAAARKLLADEALSVESLTAPQADMAEGGSRLAAIDPVERAERIGIGVPTCRDILEALARPGRDPRGELPEPVFKQGILKLNDLHEGMELAGTVLNVVDFGAFIDIGLKESGMVHISKLSDRFIPSPHEVVAVGDVVTVWVHGIDAERRRVSLTMLRPGSEEAKPKATGKTKSEIEGKAASKKQQTEPRPARPSAKAGRKKPPQPRAPAQPKSAPPAKPLSQEQEKGQEPLRGFGELKQLWGDRSS
jgi:uncharacterized protein